MYQCTLGKHPEMKRDRGGPIKTRFFPTRLIFTHTTFDPPPTVRGTYEYSSFFFPPSFEVWNLYVCPYGESRLPMMFQTSFFTIFVFSNNLHEKASSADVKCPYKNTNFKRGVKRLFSILINSREGFHEKR